MLSFPWAEVVFTLHLANTNSNVNLHWIQATVTTSTQHHRTKNCHHHHQIIQWSIHSFVSSPKEQRTSGKQFPHFIHALHSFQSSCMLATYWTIIPPVQLRRRRKQRRIWVQASEYPSEKKSILSLQRYIFDWSFLFVYFPILKSLMSQVCWRGKIQKYL